MTPELEQTLYGRRKRKHKRVRNVCGLLYVVGVGMSPSYAQQPKKGSKCECGRDGESAVGMGHSCRLICLI